MALKTMLLELLQAAEAQPFKAVRKRLAKGLTVALYVMGDEVSIQLSRADVLPSMTEWNTVLNCWPGEKTVVQEPKELPSRLGKHYLRGAVRKMHALPGLDGEQ